MNAGASAVLVLCLFVAAYALHHGTPAGTTPVSSALSLVLLFATPLYMMLKRISGIRMALDPLSDPGTTAVLIAGCDRSVGWFMAQRLCEMGILVFAGFEDPSSATAKWLKRYLKDGLHPVRLRAGEMAAEDARAAAQQVERNLGDRVLLAAIYTAGSMPKVNDTLDAAEIQKGIEVNALGPVTLSQYFGPLLHKYGGRFVVLSDLAGRLALPSILPYCMSHAIGQQFINVIRKNMEKLGVSVHVVEPLLYIWECAQNNLYPATSPEDGKVIFSRDAQFIDCDLFEITQSIYHACFAKSPKAWYLPRMNDFFMDKVITFSPRFLLNWIAPYIEEITNIYVPPLEKGWED